MVEAHTGDKASVWRVTTPSLEHPNYKNSSSRTASSDDAPFFYLQDETKNLFRFSGESIQSDSQQCGSDHCLAGIGVPFVVLA